MKKRARLTRFSCKIVSFIYKLLKGQIPLHQFPVAISPQQVRNINDKSVTGWRGQKSLVSVVTVVSPRFPDSIIQRLVADLLAVSLTSAQQVGSFPVYGEVTGKRDVYRPNGFWAIRSLLTENCRFS